MVQRMVEVVMARLVQEMVADFIPMGRKIIAVEKILSEWPSLTVVTEDQRAAVEEHHTVVLEVVGLGVIGAQEVEVVTVAAGHHITTPQQVEAEPLSIQARIPQLPLGMRVKASWNLFGSMNERRKCDCRPAGDDAGTGAALNPRKLKRAVRRACCFCALRLRPKRAW